MTAPLRLRFWGVRGSSAVPGPATAEFGGNTSCLELEDAAADLILFDAGTGIREAGVNALPKQPKRVHLFLTHFHWDHIQGLPFLPSLYNPYCNVTIYSSRFSAPLREAMSGLMAPPYFPVPFDQVPSVELVDMDDSSVTIDGARITPVEVNHPQGACGYSVESVSQGRNVRFLYVPDREHGHPSLDDVLLEAAQGANALVIDSQYTTDEYETKRGWGHSTWNESVRLAQAAKVDNLVLFHHDPGHSDEALRKIEAEARKLFPKTYAAREGWALEL